MYYTVYNNGKIDRQSRRSARVQTGDDRLLRGQLLVAGCLPVDGVEIFLEFVSVHYGPGWTGVE